MSAADDLFSALDLAVKRARGRRKMTEHITDEQADCPCPSCRHYQSINDGTHDPATCPWSEAHP